MRIPGRKRRRQADVRSHLRDNGAVTAILAVLLIIGPLSDRQITSSRLGVALTVGVAVAVAAVVQFALRP